MFTRATIDSVELEFKLIKRGVRIDKFKADCLPPVLSPPGISYERAKYLHHEVREFVSPEFRDVLCPPPTDI